MSAFAYDAAGRLLADGVLLAAIADTVGTPTYVYARRDIERRYQDYDAAFAGHEHLIAYSVKANSALGVLRVLSELGAGADIVSRGELLRARRAGVPPEKIVMSGVGKTELELNEAADAGILAFNVESRPELARVVALGRRRGRPLPIAIRVNPDVDPQTHPYIATGLKEAKFGLPVADAFEVARALRGEPGVRLVGLDCHIGSQITSTGPFGAALDSLLALADRLAAEGQPLELLDLGGGLGIAYDPAEPVPPHPTELGPMILARMAGRRERLVLEPGRSLVGNAGVLLSRVEYVKRTAAKTFVILDAAMNDLVRPSLYQAFHEIRAVAPRPGPLGPVDVVGPVCETGDTFARDRVLPELVAGDLVAIMSAGAYGASMASNYNSRPRAAEVMVDGSSVRVIRRRQPLEALLDGEDVLGFDPEREGSSP